MSTQTYQGEELSIFAGATRWKRYWSSRVAPYMRGTILDAGAGIGSNLDYLANPQVRRWVALEPDAELARQIAAPTDFPLEVRVGTIGDVPHEPSFDAILYADVLEHIESDGEELEQAAARLRPGGHLIVLTPAHDWLYSPFDREIGHWRRYNRTSLAALTPPGLTIVRCEYLDSAGLLLSFANRALLRQSMPTARQIEVWDRFVVPASRVLDPLLLRRAGKSVLGVWRKPR